MLDLDLQDLDLLDAELVGAFGDNMLAAFAAAGTPSLADVRAGKATIRKGMKGEPVQYIQQHAGLGGKDVDGVFGDKTEQAVRKIQAAMDLGVDGVVDRGTLIALDSIDVYRIHEKAPRPAGPVPAPPGSKAVAERAADTQERAAETRERNQIIAGTLGLLALVGIGVAVATH